MSTMATLPWEKPRQQGARTNQKCLAKEYSPRWACFLLTVFEAFGRLERRCDRGESCFHVKPFFHNDRQGHPSLEFQNQR